MNITYFDDYAAMSERAAQLYLRELRQKPDLLVCPASGRSPEGLYQKLGEIYEEDPTRFDRMKLIELDEWGGISRENPNSCRTYLRDRLLEPLNIPGDRLITFDPESEHPERECRRVQELIDRKGPIDFCILGMGTNGHIGFNEPAPLLRKDCHVADLAAETMQRGRSEFGSGSEPPTYGLTLGMKDIMQSGKILLLLTGEGKQEAIEKLLAGEITTRLPASLLWLHGDVECLVDRDAV